MRFDVGWDLSGSQFNELLPLNATASVLNLTKQSSPMTDRHDLDVCCLNSVDNSKAMHESFPEVRESIFRNNTSRMWLSWDTLHGIDDATCNDLRKPV